MLKSICLFTLFAMSAASLHATDSLYNDKALMADIDSSGNAVLVTGSEASAQLVFVTNGANSSWAVKLDSIPKEISVLPGGRVLVLERGDLLTEERENNRVVIYNSKGVTWQAPGLTFDAVWSPKDDRFLIKTILNDQHLLQVYTDDGNLEHEVQLASTAEGDQREMTFSSDGMAVFLSPTEFFGTGHMEIHSLNGEAPFVVDLDPKIRIIHAFALSDAEIVFVASDGSLRQLNKQGVVFEIHGKNKPFYDLELSPDGQYVLAKGGINGFDVYDTATGLNLWQADARSNTQKMAKELNLNALPGLKAQSLNERASFLVGLRPRIQDGGISLENSTAGYQFWIGDPTNITESLTQGKTHGKSLCTKTDSSWQVLFSSGQTVREQLPLSTRIRVSTF